MKIRRPVLKVVLCLISLSTALLGVSSRTFAQDKFDYETELKLAFRLIEENKFPDALAILEKLAASKPDDAMVIERLALALVVTASSSKNSPEQTKKDLIRARSLAQKAKELGADSPVISTILEQIPAEGAIDALSEKKRSPAEEVLLEGEGAFARGDFDKALEYYEKAAKLDPKLYEAPLFIGDVYFKTKRIEKAGEAYTRAIAVDPGRETAYRYWGNALMQAGQMNEAKEKFIEAIIAEPYNRTPWQFLMGWAQRNKIELTHPRIDVPRSSVKRKDDKNIDVTAMLSEEKDGSSAWTAYSLVRASWMTGDKFEEAYPDEKQYRNSLREEASALNATVDSVEIQLKEGRVKEDSLEISIANLRKLRKAGLIEAYVLLAMANEGIARDYAEYRKNNRDRLRRYLNEYVTAGK